MADKNFKVKNGLDIGDNISISEAGVVEGLTTDNLDEGTNLYYTEARVDANFATKTTDDLTEGTNLYYADSLVDAHLTGGVGVDYTTGTISIGQDVATTASVIFSDLTLQNQTSGGGANLTGDILGSVVISGYDGAEWVKDNLANVSLTFKAAENFANDGAGNTTAAGTELDLKLQPVGYQVNSQTLGTATVDSRMGLFRTLGTGLETITADNTSTIESPGRRVLYIGDTTAAYLPYKATSTDGTKEYLGFPRTDILYQNSNFVIGGVPKEQYCEFTVDSFVSTPSAGDVRGFLGQSGVPNDIFGVIINSVTPPSYIRSGSTINSIHSSSAALPAATMVLGFLSTAPAGGGYYIHRYRVSAYGGFSPSALGTNNIRVSNYELVVTETSGSIGTLDTIYDPISATQNAKIIKASDNTVWTNYEPTTTGATSCGPDNYAIRDTNIIEFISARQNAQSGRRSALKSGDTIGVVKATGINSYNQGQATATNSYESFLKIVATEDYTTTVGGSALEVELIKTGTTSQYTALDIKSASATVSADTVVLKDSAGTALSGQDITYSRSILGVHNHSTIAPSAADEAFDITFDETPYEANNISVVSNKEITFAKTGKYRMRFSGQAVNAGSNSVHTYVWLTKNGSQLADSSRKVTLLKSNSGDSASLVDLEWILDATAGDYYVMKFASDATTVSLVAISAGVPSEFTNTSIPAVPSATLIVTPIGA